MFISVRLCKDRLDLVRQAIHSKDGAYKQKQKVRNRHCLVLLYKKPCPKLFTAMF